MKSEVETLSPTRVKLTVEVPLEEMKSDMDAAYRSIASQISIPGFRKGKVPARIVDARVGRGAVIQEAINEALPRLYSQALSEGEITPLAQPELEITDVPDPQAGGDLKFVAEVDVLPAFDLPEFSSLSVQLDSFEVTDEDVQARLDDLRERFGTLVGVDRPAADGDFVSIDLTATIGDEEIDSASGLSYQIGTGTLLEGMDEALVGLSAGEETTFEAPLAGGEHAGEQALIRVSVGSVKERELPEADDEFAELASEFETIDELLADLRQQADQQKRFQVGLGARDKVLDALLEAIDLPVPEKVIETEVHSHLEEENRLEDDEHRAEVTEQTTKSLRTQLVLDKIADSNELGVEQHELIEYMVQQAQAYGLAPQQFLEQVQQAGQLPAMMGEIRRRKALALVLEAATITDADGNVTSIDELLPRPIAEDDEVEAAEDGEATVEDEAVTDGDADTEGVGVSPTDVHVVPVDVAAAPAEEETDKS